MLSALLEVAIATPYELAFITPDLNFWFFKNRFCDTVFCMDIVIRFLTAVPDKNVGGRLVTDLGAVARLYLTQWFIIDLLSTLPWDAYYLWVKKYSGRKDSCLFEVLRMLRIFRLARLTNGRSILRRFNIYFGFQWKAVTMAQNFMFLMLVCHWSACFWGGCGLREPQAEEQTWLEVVQATKGGPASLYNSPVNVYLISLYWAVMTITGIGYGDITPQNAGEYLAAVFLMTGMAAGWAYIIGEITASMSNLNPHEVGFKQSVDALNSLLLDWNVPHEKRKSLRTYFHEAKDLWRYLEQKRTLDQLSPNMQGEISLMLHNEWIGKVRYLRHQDTTALMPVLHHLRAMMYGPGEMTSKERCLYIVWRGLCIRRGRIFSRNEVWGEDMILHNDLLRSSCTARAVGYVELFMLIYEDLCEIAEKVPEIKQAVEKQRKYIALLRAFVLIKRILKELHFRKIVNRFALTRKQRCQLSDGILSGELTEELVTDSAALERAFTREINIEEEGSPSEREFTDDSDRPDANIRHASAHPRRTETMRSVLTEPQERIHSGDAISGAYLTRQGQRSSLPHNGILHPSTSSLGSLGNMQGISPGLKGLAVELVEEFLVRAQSQEQGNGHFMSYMPSTAHWMTSTPTTMVRNVASRGLRTAITPLESMSTVAHRFKPALGWR